MSVRASSEVLLKEYELRMIQSTFSSACVENETKCKASG